MTSDAMTTGRVSHRRWRFTKALGRHAEHHHGDRIGWLRAAVLGANDGIVSTASMVLGVAAVDEAALAQRLQREGVEAFATSWHAMLSRIGEQREP